MVASSLRPVGLVHHDGVAVLELVQAPMSNWAPVLKMAEDLILSAIVLLFASPLMVLVALAVKFDSRGPVFFRQSRHDFNHQVISVLKFRTMSVVEDGLQVPQARRDDPRITPVSKFLRRTSSDELPQLINVLREEMSLVGTRPHALTHNAHYSALLETYASRRKLKPGITGWAQVNGLRGETDTPEKMRKRIEYHLYYIENWSIWFDIKILFMTPIFVLLGKYAF
jgi:putative colanic acid biosynthesis UDP-glucose lipid carrier transferase